MVRFAIDVACALEPGDLVTLSGDLGAGKTTFARALIRYLADDDTIEVPSPTFTLLQTYELPRFDVVHADLYRLSSAAELSELGFDDLPEDAVVLMEWGDRAAGFLPANRLDITFTLAPAAWRRGPRCPLHRLWDFRGARGAHCAGAQISRRGRLRRGETRADAGRRFYAHFRAPDARRTNHGSDECAAASRRPADPRRQALQRHRSPGREYGSLRGAGGRLARAQSFSAGDPACRHHAGIGHHGGSRRRAHRRGRSAGADRGALSGRARCVDIAASPPIARHAAAISTISCRNTTWTRS